MALAAWSSKMVQSIAVRLATERSMALASEFSLMDESTTGTGKRPKFRDMAL
jgi:hypothetical protein